jgi:hypothetical protein
MNALYLWSTQKQDYMVVVNEAQLEEMYRNSQYVNPDSTTWIEDSPLYTLAGLKYIKGEDPSQINFELQPTTKYVFGLATLLFGNPLVVQIGLYGALIVLTFLLSKKILGESAINILPSLLVSLDPLVRSQAHTVYLDLSQTVLIVLFILIAPLKKPTLTGIIIGAIALSKSFMIGGLVFVVYMGWQGLQRVYLKTHVQTALIAIITYLTGYSMFFVKGNTLVDFVELHWKILKLYKGYVPEYPKGEVFRIIAVGEWRKWYGDFGLARVSEWWIFWPIALLGSVWTILTNKWKSQNDYAKLSLLFMALYGISISMKLVFPRYLMPLLPLLYIFSTRMIVQNKNQT